MFATQPYELPTPTDSRDSSSPSGWNGTIESLYDGSEYSTNTTFQSSSPVNGTSSTFYSNDIWSPLESPIDEELLFSPFPRNEFYTADGKTSGFYPSPDNQPVKSEGRFCGDGSLHSGWGLDRTHSERLREITESIPTMRPSRSTRVDSQILQVGREDSGSTDESPVTGYIVNRSRAP